MKTSVKLLFGIAIATLLTMIGAGWSFRQQYDQLDHQNPFAQYIEKPLTAFRVLKLIGGPGETFLIQPGPAPVIRIDTDVQAQITYQTKGDTLVVRYRLLSADSVSANGMSPGASLRGRPIAVVSAPSLQTILSAGATCRVNDWQLPSLTLIQTGTSGATQVSRCTIRLLQATVTGGSLLTMSDRNTIGQASVTLKDLANFQAGDAQFTSLELRADSAATLMLPGALLAKIR